MKSIVKVKVNVNVNVAVAALMMAACTASHAAWPTDKPINYIVPFSPGGGTDIIARVVANKLSVVLNTPVVVVNKPGAGGNIGSEYVARSAPDGYTIGGASIATHAINVSLYKNIGFDPKKDFTPISLVGTTPNVLIVNPKTPYHSVKDLIAAIRASGQPLAFASAGAGTSQHLSAELFAQTEKVRLIHVPYKGAGPALSAVMAGEVPFSFENLIVASPQIKSGAVRALAVTSAGREASFPDLPTMQEAGVAGYDVVSWQAIFAPAGLDSKIRDRLNAAIRDIFKSADVIDRMSALGVNIVAQSPEQLAQFQDVELKKWATVIKSGNVTTD